MMQKRSGHAAAELPRRAGSIFAIAALCCLLTLPWMASAQETGASAEQVLAALKTQRAQIAAVGGDWDPQTELMTVIEPHL